MMNGPAPSVRIRKQHQQPQHEQQEQIRRRGKRDKDGMYSKLSKQSVVIDDEVTGITRKPMIRTVSGTKRSRSGGSSSIHHHSTSSNSSSSDNSNKNKRGGILSLLPSFIGVAILICGGMAKMGFRGRSTVAGIDLGTTNSVICVQAPSKNVGEITCIHDPRTNSPIIPSVVSFLEKHEWKVGPSSKIESLLDPHPSTVVVGDIAKKRINSHPHHTLYNAKRILGKSYTDKSVQTLLQEVEFGIISSSETKSTSISSDDLDNNNDNDVYFTVPDTSKLISPIQVGGYVVNHLKNIMDNVLGHENVRSAVICVPAKFTSHQRQLTAQAFYLAGIKVARVIEEPTAAALAYGLHRKPNVNYIMVYDFGGGTLDISLLYVTDGFVDVMGSDGDENLGGTDFDIAIAHYLAQQQPTVIFGGNQTISKDDNNNDNHNITGQMIIDNVTKVLKALEEHLFPNGNKNNREFMDLEEMLAAKCPALNAIPLCTISSFHTIGEQLKINLSNQLDTIQQQQQVNDVTATDDINSNTNVITSSAECLGLVQGSSGSSSSSASITTLNEFCDALRPIQLSINSIEYNNVVQPLLERSIIPVQRLLNGLDLSVHDIDEIVMVGGTTRMPQIRSLVQEYMQAQQLNTKIDPDITVAYGAASIID